LWRFLDEFQDLSVRSVKACLHFSTAGIDWSLAGLMGAGRTELARSIFGADPIHAGTLTLNGTPTRIKHVADAIEKGISYLTEDRKKEGLAMTSASLCANGATAVSGGRAP
jgi:ribose transport system ATP-binding protein